MINSQKILELANEAKELIIEFRNEESRIAENILNDISTSEDGNVIYVDDEIDGEIEYELSDISTIFSTEMRGWGPCPARFYEAVSMAQSEVECEYKNMKREEFIEYVGGLYYMEYRCEEIYKRLQQIESEVDELNK